MALTHKEMTKHVRGRLKASNIPARCRLYTACGVKCIQISTVEYDARWRADQIKEIGIIAQVNHLTGARRSAIDLDNIVQLTGKNQFDFEFHG